MTPLTEREIRRCFVNATRGQAQRATVPPLADLDWNRLDYFGWRDAKAPLAGYVIIEIDGGPIGILLRAPSKGGHQRQAVCAWCEDIVEVDGVSLFVAPRAGAAGRRGDSIGTLLCGDFRCSANVRRRPTRAEAGTDEGARERLVASRIAGLQRRAAQFVVEVSRTG
ncbi:FBP domain-containing protein [Ruania zhangjianzhongii]|uniref:FBP domain-containing protein n=1 Tax=Ruania zhangjianzhongii TaxID=2603206 RepID=UPI0011C9BB52|nr:FBP domain-containing protein [Ruania zhangjianzhongii]